MADIRITVPESYDAEVHKFAIEVSANAIGAVARGYGSKREDQRSTIIADFIAKTVAALEKRHREPSPPPAARASNKRRRVESGAPPTPSEFSDDDASADTNDITMRFSAASGDVMEFIHNRHHSMDELFEAYAERVGVRADSLKFLYEGCKLRPGHAPTEVYSRIHPNKSLH